MVPGNKTTPHHFTIPYPYAQSRMALRGGKVFTVDSLRMGLLFNVSAPFIIPYGMNVYPVEYDKPQLKDHGGTAVNNNSKR